MKLPTAIIDQRASGQLSLRWEDGTESVLSHAQLRNACRCATCEQARRDGHPIAADEGVRLVRIEPVADKALNLAFSDGHYRGIYPWEYLRSL